MKHLYIIEATSLHDTVVTCAHIYGRKEAEEEKRLFQNCRHDMHDYRIRKATAEEEKEINGERITDYNRI